MKTRVVFVHEVEPFVGLKTTYDFDLVFEAKAFILMCKNANPGWKYDEEELKTVIDGTIMMVKTVTIRKRKACKKHMQVLKRAMDNKDIDRDLVAITSHFLSGSEE